MAVEKVSFGFKSKIKVDIDEIVKNFVTALFAPEIKPNDIKNYSAEKGVSNEQAKENIQKQNEDIIDNKVPMKDGSLKTEPDIKTSGAIRSLMATLTRMIYKIVGFFCEQLVYLLKPLRKLIKNNLFNVDFPKDPLNMSLSSTIVHNNKKILSTAGTPAQAPFILAQTLLIKDQIQVLQSIVTDILQPILKAIQDMNKFINTLLDDVLKDFNVPVPSITLGFAGISLSLMDNLKLFSSFGMSESEIKDVIDKAQSTVTEKDKQATVGDVDEITFFTLLQQDPVKQLDYINAINEFNRLDEFYNEPYINDTDFKGFDHTFDFFKTFNYKSSSTTEYTMYNALINSDLVNDKDFINNFYTMLKSYNIKNIPEIAKEYKNKFNIKTTLSALTPSEIADLKNRLILNVNDLFEKKLNKEHANSKDFLWVVERSFQFNFWNNLTSDDNGKNKVYVYKATRNDYLNTDFDYKRFKLKFWNLIPKDKLNFFMSFTDSYIVNFVETQEYKDNLTETFTETLRISNDRRIGGDQITQTGGQVLAGILKNNDFRKRIGLAPLVAATESSYIKHNSFNDYIKANYTKLGAGALWLLISSEFFKNILMIPINLLMTGLNMLMDTIKNVLTLNLPAAISMIKKFLQFLVPTKDFFVNIIKIAVDEMLKPFLATIANNTEGFAEFIERLLFDALPQYFLDVITPLFKYVIEQITTTIPL